MIDGILYLSMRYKPQHKAEVHQRLVKDASRRVLAEGLTGAAVTAVMQQAGLTHGGFYKHFANKDELLTESLREGFHEIADVLAHAAERSRPGEAWKNIVKAYLRPEMCDHPEHGCPLAALASELSRVNPEMKAQIIPELLEYKERMVPFMPGRRMADKERAFFAIFSTMTGAVAIARILPVGEARTKVLSSARDLLLRGFESSEQE